MERFIPPGYVSTERAILALSQAAAPAVWQDMSEEEQFIWQTTVMSFNGGQLVACLISYLKKIISTRSPLPCQMRVIHYRDATLDLIKRLKVGDLTAWTLDNELHFGRARKESWKAPQHPWAWTGTCIEVLETGRNTFGGSNRNVFLFQPEVNTILEELQAWAKTVAEEASMGRNKREAARILSQAHEPGTHWPPLADDWALLKSTPECRHITRDEVEKLRKELNPDLLPRRGRPAKNPEAKSRENKIPKG